MTEEIQVQEQEVKEMKSVPLEGETATATTAEIANVIGNQKLASAFMTVVKRAEIHSMLEGEDYFITAVENGIAYFSETNYNNLVESTLTGLRAYLVSQNIAPDVIEVEVDAYASNLVIHYIDHTVFPEEAIAEAKAKYTKAPVEPVEQVQEVQDEVLTSNA